MALFALLMAIVIERLKLLPERWQYNYWMARYHQLFFGQQPLSALMTMMAVGLPTIVTALLLWEVEGWLWGVVTVMLWVVIAALCFCHQKQRQAFKSYIEAAKRGDVQACYHFVEKLDSGSCTKSCSESELGILVGQSVAWINYSYYGVVALFLMAFGPVGAVFYCSVRYYSEHRQHSPTHDAYVDRLLTILDWLPSRIFAFGYVLSGRFNHAIAIWRKKAFDVTISAREIVTEVALSAEDLPEVSAAPVCLRPTLALLQLSKRNFILLITLLSLFTIFGVVH